MHGRRVGEYHVISQCISLPLALQIAGRCTQQTNRPCSGNVVASPSKRVEITKIVRIVTGLPAIISARRMLFVVPVALLLAAAGMLSVKGVRNMIVSAVSSIKGKQTVVATASTSSTIVAHTPFGECASFLDFRCLVQKLRTRVVS